MGDIDTSATLGVEARGYRRGTLSTDSWDQYVIPTADRVTSFRGRSNTFRTLGRATATQTLLVIHNATGSAVNVLINRITVDLLTTVVKAATVIPPIVRVNRVTALPAGGTALAKNALNSLQFPTSSSSVVITGDSSADGTNSPTALTHTSVGIIAQKWAPRMLSAVGYEPVDTLPFFYGEPDVALAPQQGLAISLEQATVTTGNPATDMWVVDIDWEEFTRP